MWLYLQPRFSLKTFTGHTSHVVSLDFHPKKNDLFCSCDGNNEIRFWNINQYACTRISKVSHEAPLHVYFFCFCSWSSDDLNSFSILNFGHLMEQGGTAQVRFQPRIGQLLAAASDNVVSIFDIESDRQTHSLQVLVLNLEAEKTNKTPFTFVMW